jgi:hypothetical protein
LSGLFEGLWENHAATDPGAADPQLRGRTYTIPFDTVWQASVTLAGGGQRSWGLQSADDQRGVIEALVRGGSLSAEVGVRITVSLDEHAQTRVDVEASSRSGRSDLGRSRRVVRRFLRRLDTRLGAGPAQIVDPARMSEFFAAWRDGSAYEPHGASDREPREEGP